MHEKGVFGWLNVIFVKWCKEEEKWEENGAIFRNTYLANYRADLLQIWYVCRVAYMESIKHVNLIEIGPLVTEI